MTRHEEQIIKEWLKEMNRDKDETVREAVNNLLESYFTLQDMWRQGLLADTGYAVPLTDMQPAISRIETVYDDSIDSVEA